MRGNPRLVKQYLLRTSGDCIIFVVIRSLGLHALASEKMMMRTLIRNQPYGVCLTQLAV
jgi:hypothetical protein